jgi:ferrous iron transport protein B
VNKEPKEITIALAGNPNAGKTTLFNALTGLKQKVANFPGVTVERKEGGWQIENFKSPVRLIDLPGLYSLEANSLDEEIARDVLTGKVPELSAPDLIIAVVSATNLERNLYLVTQLFEYNIPIVIALTMFDDAQKANLEIDVNKLSALLEIPVVPVTVSKNVGLEELSHTVSQVLTQRVPPPKIHLNGQNPILSRYNWIFQITQEAVGSTTDSEEVSFSEKLDRVLTHKIFGLIALSLILLLVFQAIFTWATLPMDLLDSGFGTLSEVIKSNLPPGILTDLLTDGIIAGVGGVLVFLPQILMLFLFISILEDSGYMARAAFLLDRVMRSVGLHGKAFVPLLSSFACAIPGIMATRTIENPKDRLTTILIAPLMSCSARLPVYTLMIAAFFSGQYLFGFLSMGAVIILSMYFLGIITAIIVGFILKRTVLKAPPPPFVMELPPYRLPNPRTIIYNMVSRAGLFVRRAGTVILALSIILWALTNFPRHSPPDLNNSAGQTQTVENEELQKEAEKKAASEQIRTSYAGQLGHLIEPVIKPLGFDWKIGVALISSFAAREVLVSTLNIIYNGEKDSEADNETLVSAVREAKHEDETPAWTPLTAITVMVFFVLACQCISTVAVVRRETNSWAWTFFMVVYMTTLAYVAAFITFQFGKILGF